MLLLLLLPLVQVWPHMRFLQVLLLPGKKSGGATELPGKEQCVMIFEPHVALLSLDSSVLSDVRLLCCRLRWLGDRMSVRVSF